MFFQLDSRMTTCLSMCCIDGNVYICSNSPVKLIQNNILNQEAEKLIVLAKQLQETKVCVGRPGPS